MNAGQEGNTITNSGTFFHDDAPTPNPTNNAETQIDENFDIVRVGADTVSAASAEQGSIINFLNVFQNIGTATDVYNITLSSNSYPQGTTFTFYQVDGSDQPTAPFTDTNNDGIVDTGPVLVNEVIKVILEVNLPSGQSGGPFGVIKTLTSINDPAESDFHTDVVQEVTTPTVDITNVAEIGNGSETGTG